MFRIVGSSVGRRGDTIIEVMMALSIFSMIAVGALAVMNRSISMAQDALESTLVRNEIDAQAETLRFLHHAYMAESSPNLAAGTLANKFMDIIKDDNVITDGTASEFGKPTCITEIPQKAFAVNPINGKLIPSGSIKPMSEAGSGVPPYSQLSYPAPTAQPTAHGLWIEGVKSRSVTASGSSEIKPVVDFHIRACWSSAYSSQPRTIGTIVRLHVK
ncbi:prepilin-type N-terminal cleavage/methylation domain-containing protein [Candidatus Nomurabacteria bacterium]|nr:prepilin-type N-terminal cleavage/methylation domain-containing protein [Candidatus Nomurabacteria bacterium]